MLSFYVPSTPLSNKIRYWHTAQIRPGDGLQAKLYVLCKVLGKLTTIIIKLVAGLLAKLMGLYHSGGNCALSTGVFNMTRANKPIFF
jgi:hypothetical protein